MSFLKRKKENIQIHDPIPLPPHLREKLGVCIGHARDDLPFLQGAGVKHARVSCYWDQMLDPRPHAHLQDRTVRDDFFWQLDTLTGAGIHLLIVVHSAPADDLEGARIGEFVADLSTRVPPWTILQLHNEMNIPGSGFTPVLHSQGQFDRGREYGLMFNHTQQMLEIAGLPRKLITGGLVGNPQSFLLGMEDVGCNPDGIALHCYGYPPYHQLTTNTALARAIYPATPIYITEIGSEGGTTNEQVLRLDLEGTIQTLRADPPWVERAYWFALQSTAQYGYGLVLDGQPRPTYTTFTHALR